MIQKSVWAQFNLVSEHVFIYCLALTFLAMASWSVSIRETNNALRKMLRYKVKLCPDGFLNHVRLGFRKTFRRTSSS